MGVFDEPSDLVDRARAEAEAARTQADTESAQEESERERLRTEARPLVAEFLEKVRALGGRLETYCLYSRAETRGGGTGFLGNGPPEVVGYESTPRVCSEAKFQDLRKLARKNSWYWGDALGLVHTTEEAWYKPSAIYPETKLVRYGDRGLCVFSSGIVVEFRECYDDSENPWRLDGVLSTEQLTEILAEELQNFAKRAAETNS